MQKLFLKTSLFWLILGGLVWGRPTTIFDYSAQLKLQEGQTQNLRDLLNELRQQSARLQTSLVREEQSYRQLVSQQAELGEIRKSLNRIQDLRVSLRMLDISSQRKLEGVLTTQQLGQWRAIQAQIQKQKKL